MDLALRTYIQLIYKGVNISEDISNDLIAFSFTDNEHGTADDIDISLKNNHGLWSGDWLPTLGDKLEASIIQVGRGAKPTLFCGTFTLDEFEIKHGGGSIVSIRGASVPSEKSIRKTVKSRGWEKVKLSEIAMDIATNGALKLNYATSIDPLYDRKDQSGKADLEFLKQLCDDEALNLKVTSDQLVIFDPQEMDARPPATSLIYGSSDIIDASFRTQNHDTYSESTVEYNDPATGKTQKHTEKSKKIQDGKTLKTTKRATNQADAERLAKAKLYNANRKETTATFTILGDTRLQAGDVVDVIGWGKMDGTYKITKATHSLSNGYVTGLDLDNTNNPPKPKPEAEKTPKEKKKTEVKKKAEESKKPKKAKTTKAKPKTTAAPPRMTRSGSYKLGVPSNDDED